MSMSVYAKAKIDNILPLLYSEYIGVWLSHGLLVI